MKAIKGLIGSTQLVSFDEELKSKIINNNLTLSTQNIRLATNMAM